LLDGGVERIGGVEQERGVVGGERTAGISHLCQERFHFVREIDDGVIAHDAGHSLHRVHRAEDAIEVRAGRW
jgi:hypothetical protein